MKIPILAAFTSKISKGQKAGNYEKYHLLNPLMGKSIEVYVDKKRSIKIQMFDLK